MGRVWSVLFSVVVLSLAQSMTAIADTPDYVWRRDALPTLNQAQRFVEYGQLTAGGCAFTTAAPTVTSPGYVVTRQLAVDFRRCIAITEVGVRSSPLPEQPSTNKVPAPPERRGGGGSMGGKLASPSYQWYTISGYAKYYYTDLIGYWLTRVTTSITRTIDFAGCVSSVSGGAYLEWSWGWELLPGYYYSTSISYCPSGHSATVNAYGTFHGTINTGCYQYYNPAYASASGYSMTVSGSVTGMSSNCGPVFKNIETWNGVPPG